MQRKRNIWFTESHEVVVWLARFPPAHKHGMDWVIPFVTRFVEAGEREQICRVVSGGQRYLEHVSALLKQTGECDLFSSWSGPNPPTFDFSVISKVAYYDESGEVREEEVENVGLLLQRIQPDDGWRGAFPIDVYGSMITLRPPSDPLFADDAEIATFKLYTDLWFPRVAGVHAAMSDVPDTDDMYDNSELALLHTPRLNRFLAAMREVTLEYGGKWTLDTCWSGYASQCREFGIYLKPRLVT